MAVVATVRASTAQDCAPALVYTQPNGTALQQGSDAVAISPDGRFVALEATVSLLPQDTNASWDVYVVDTFTGALELISLATNGAAGNNHSSRPCSFSSDGRFVSFASRATNFASSNTPGTNVRTFLRDRALQQTILVSADNNGVDADGAGNSPVSGDGRYVAFTSSRDGLAGETGPAGFTDVYLRDVVLGTTELISATVGGTSGNSWSSSTSPQLAISENARYVVFASRATDLVAVDGNGSMQDVFRRDRSTGVTELVSVGSGGQANAGCGGAACSEDGRFVVFLSGANNLVPGDTNGQYDIFVRDMLAGTTERTSEGYGGIQANGICLGPAISPDGRFTTFSSTANHLVPGDTNGVSDAFVVDRFTKRVQLVCITSSGVQSSSTSYATAISRDAGTVLFRTDGALVAADNNNGYWDAYVRTCRLPTEYCTAKVNSLGCTPMISSSGVPMASWPHDFVISATSELNSKTGVLLYSSAGRLHAPFQGGTLCLLSPVHRTPTQSSGGSPTGSDCTGTFTFDFNAWIATGIDPSLTPGTSVWAQYWSRDPGFAPPNNSSLTNALSFVIWP